MATSQLAQTTLRVVLGKHELDEMLAERERLNLDVQRILDSQTDGWGIKVTNVEIKHIDLNEIDGARHRPPGGGRARASRQGDSRRGREAGGGRAARGGADARAAAGGDAAALPADDDAGRRRPRLDDRLPAALRPASRRPGRGSQDAGASTPASKEIACLVPMAAPLRRGRWASTTGRSNDPEGRSKASRPPTCPHGHRRCTTRSTVTGTGRHTVLHTGECCCAKCSRSSSSASLQSATMSILMRIAR